MSSRVEIKAHPRLIYDVIERQAGTFSKAVLEGVMNSIEAYENPNDAVVEITLCTNGARYYSYGAVLTISDQGRGIQNRQEIDDYFLTFGTPHEASENKTWAQFRMGRGQIFSYGINTWRTSTFQMVVDISKDKAANEFPHCDLVENLPFVSGCQIVVNLYRNPISDIGYTMEAFEEELRQQLEFMPGKILFNGKQINVHAEDMKWTYVDDNAYYMFHKGNGLQIYNMGAYVMTISAVSAGITGVIVTKKMLKVNFARNAVQQDSCPLWPHIMSVVQDNRIKKVRKSSKRLTKDERIAALIDLRNGAMQMKDLRTIGLIPTTNGRLMRLDEIRRISTSWTFGDPGDRLCDQWNQSGYAVCLSSEILDQLSYRGDRKQFFKWLLYENPQQFKEWDRLSVLYRDMEYLEQVAGSNRTFDTIPTHKLTTYEKRIIRVLEDIKDWDGRRISIGVSGCAWAWTDGKTYITIDRNYLGMLNLSHGYIGAANLVYVLYHELAHDEETNNTHEHNEEFYRRFHDIVSGDALAMIGTFADSMRKAAKREIEEKKIRKEKGAKAARDKALGKTGETNVVL